MRNKNIYYLLGLFLAVIAAISYATFDGLLLLEQTWSTQEEYGYAYMIPFVTCFLIWQKLNELDEAKFELSLLGGIIFIGSLLVLLLGIFGAARTIVQYGYILSIIATLYMLMGKSVLRIVIAPMLLLLVAIPIPVFLFDNLSGYLQLISSELGVWVIRLFGISVYLEGNVIDLGAFKLQVVEACSGLRYLFPLFSLSLIAAFLFDAKFWQRLVLVLSSIPITVFMNSFRIGVIGVLVEHWGIEQAEGFLHDFEGWIIFMACTVLLILEMWVLLKIGSDNRPLSDAFAIDIPETEKLNFASVDVGMKHFVVTAVAIGLAVSIGLVHEREEFIPDRETFAEFPLTVDDWTGRRGSVSAGELNILQLDDYFIADYVNSSNDEAVNFYAAYYKSQRSGNNAHSPKACIPGGGWEIKDFSVQSIDVSDADERMKVNRLLIAKGEYAQLVYYWFPQRNRNITNEYLVKWFVFLDSIMLNRTDGALIRVITKIKPGEDVGLADKRLLDFIKSTKSSYARFIPE